MNRQGDEGRQSDDPMYIQISDPLQGMRLDTFLSRREFPDALRISRRSRRFWQQKIASEEVTVNGKHASKGLILKPGMTIEIRLRPASADVTQSRRTTTGEPAGSPGKLAVLYEDEWLLAVDKPEGSACHPMGIPRRGSPGSVLEQLAGSYPEVLPVKENSGDTPSDPSRWREGYLLHRLDNWTSGVLLFARNQEAFETFRSLIRGSAEKSAVEKEYLARVEGRIPGSLPLSIEFPIAHSMKRSSGKMVAVQNSPEEGKTGSFPLREKYRGKPRAAKTRILSCSISRDGGSICRILISRGQRHQIRCHLAAIGCPIQGDTLYGAAPLKQNEGFLLQHQKIRFFHPFLQKEMIIEAPLPEWVRKARF